VVDLQADQRALDPHAVGERVTDSGNVTPPDTAFEVGATGIRWFRLSSSQPPGRWATGSEPVQGDGPGRLRHARYVRRKEEFGMAHGHEPYGHGGSVVVAGVTPCQGGRESRLHGRRGPGVHDRRRR
jgi:hypothetical protein